MTGSITVAAAPRPTSAITPPPTNTRPASAPAGTSDVGLGLVALAGLSWRRTLFLLLLPLCVVAMQAPVHFEARYALPLYALYPLFEGVGWVLLLAAAVAALRRLRHFRARGAGAPAR